MRACREWLGVMIEASLLPATCSKGIDESGRKCSAGKEAQLRASGMIDLLEFRMQEGLGSKRNRGER